MSHTKRSMVRTAITLGIMGMSCSAAFAQRAPQTKEGASIVVDGIVREVFRSPRQTQVDYVIQIEVSRSEYGRLPADPKRVQAPAPGDQIYVHVFQPSPEHQGRAGASGHASHFTPHRMMFSGFRSRNDQGNLSVDPCGRSWGDPQVWRNRPVVA